MVDEEGEMSEIDITGIPFINIKRRNKRKKEIIEEGSEKSEENETVSTSEHRKVLD